MGGGGLAGHWEIPEFVPALQPQADSWIPPSTRSSQEELDTEKLNSQNSYPHCSHKQIPRSRPRSKNADLLFSCRISIENGFYNRWVPANGGSTTDPPSKPTFLTKIPLHTSADKATGIRGRGDAGSQRVQRSGFQRARGQGSATRDQGSAIRDQG